VNIEEMEVKELDEKRAAEWVEPFKTAPLPISGAVVHFRLLRLSDMIQAEDYARQQESNQMVPKSALHTYTLAKHIVKVGTEEMNILTAKSWVKDAFSKDLRALQAEFSKWETGYELTPEFLCVHCGALFRARLPLDGSFFRAASSGNGGASPPTI
jgi:hypothetical protein